MDMLIFVFIMFFLAAIQTAIPYLVKRTVIFGVTVPERFLNDPRISGLKKTYSYIVGITSLVFIIIFVFWALNTTGNTEQVALYGTIIQFAIIILSLALYFYFHGKMRQLKRSEQWFSSKNQVQAAALSVREEDNLLPWYLYVLPMLISVGLIIYTIINYDLLPDQIPTHWGINGQPDAFTDKTIASAIMMPLILLIMQIMFLGIQIGYQQSGIKVNAGNVALSKHRQLTLRKYSSWFMFGTTLLITLLFTFFHLSMIHPNIVSNNSVAIIPLVVMALIFIGTIAFAIKVGRSDKKFIENHGGDIQEFDEDKYWKGGLFYVNKNDPSIFVEKRFGVGWTINFGNYKAYLIIVLPLVVLLLLTFFL